MNYNNIMVDVETKATSKNAKLLSIGACAFDAERPPNLQEVCRETFYINVGDYKPETPFIESEITMQWWDRQGEEAKQVLEADRKDPEEAIRSFFAWTKKFGDHVKVWANPPQFDLEILRHHFEIFGLNCPWHWSAERDFRTIRETARLKRGFIPSEPAAVATKDKTIVFVKHNALHDAIMQTDKLLQILQHIKRG